MVDAAGNSRQYVESGEFKPILVLDAEPYKGFREVETASTLNIPFFVHLSRGFFVSSKLSAAKIPKLSEAYEKAFHSTVFQTYHKNQPPSNTAFLDAPKLTARMNKKVDKH